MPQDNIHFTSEQVLDELAARICSGLKAAAEARCHAWHHHLDIGDALIEAQERVSIGWKRWLRTNCALSVRSAFRYAQLARQRDKIEAEIQATGGALSMRAALRLITEPSTRKKKAGVVETATAEARPQERRGDAPVGGDVGGDEKMPPFEEWSDLNWMTALDEISTNQLVELLPWTRLLSVLGAERLLEVMPPDLRKQLETQFARQLKARDRKPFKPAKNSSKPRVVAGREHAAHMPVPVYEPEKVAPAPAPEPPAERTYHGRRILDDKTIH
jgi:hypothetical protein